MGSSDAMKRNLPQSDLLEAKRGPFAPWGKAKNPVRGSRPVEKESPPKGLHEPRSHSSQTAGRPRRYTWARRCRMIVGHEPAQDQAQGVPSPRA